MSARIPYPEKAALILALLAAAVWPRAAWTEEGRMRLFSPAFGDHQMIPARFTCEGADISPPLSWSDVPRAARSLALIVDDPDAPDPRAPRVVWVHWVAHDIPPDAQGLAEGASRRAMPRGAVEGYNDWERIGYGGPCPPVGRHRYVFSLHALDAPLPARPMTKAELLAAMEGHVLAKARLVGLYGKRR